MRKETIRKIIISALVIFTIGSLIGSVAYFFPQKGGEKTPQVVKQAVDFINEMVKVQGVSVNLISWKKEGELYKLNFKIGEQEYQSFVTKDGKYLFPYAIELAQKSQQEPETQQTQIEKREKPVVELFVMSFCPFGNQAEELMKPVIDLLGEKIDFAIHYIISKNSDGQFFSLHGPQELNQDVREICVFKYQKEKFWDFLLEINKSCTSQNADTCWENAGKNVGIDTEKIKECEKFETNSILEEELKAVEKYKVSASPQLFINETEYKGTRSANAYKDAICSGFITPPSECQEELTSESAPSAGGCR